MAIHDAFVVKYEATPAQDLCDTALSDNDVALGSASPARKLAGQRYLPLHCDQSSHSFTISLNPSGDYIGGGTYFPAMGTVLRPGLDDLLIFQCANRTNFTLAVELFVVCCRLRPGAELPWRHGASRRRTY